MKSLQSQIEVKFREIPQLRFPPLSSFLLPPASGGVEILKHAVASLQQFEKIEWCF